MEYEYKIDNENNIYFLSIKGKCGVDEIINVFSELSNHSDFHPDLNGLTDLQNCEFSFNHKVMEDLTQNIKSIFAGSKGKAAVIVATPRVTALTSIHQKNMVDTREVRIFSTYESAMEWLMED